MKNRCNLTEISANELATTISPRISQLEDRLTKLEATLSEISVMVLMLEIAESVSRQVRFQPYSKEYQVVKTDFVKLFVALEGLISHPAGNKAIFLSIIL
jgi:hypothetical protein